MQRAGGTADATCGGHCRCNVRGALPVQRAGQCRRRLGSRCRRSRPAGPPVHTRFTMHVRAAEQRELDHLARLWFDGWRDAHETILPAELGRLRTLESFRERLQSGLASVRVAGPPDAPFGFSMVKGDELYQLYVSAQSRGTGVAAALTADAEARIAGAGYDVAWLACAIGNERA